MPTNVDPGAGLLKEALKTPFIKDILRLNLQHADPARPGGLVRTLLWQDVEPVLALLGALPQLANALISSLNELAGQLGEKFSPELLLGFLKSLADEVDSPQAQAAARAWGALLKGLWRLTPEARLNLARLTAAGLNRACARLNDIQARDPECIGAFIGEVFRHLDTRELARASTTLGDALLDQRLSPLIPWTARLLSGRIRKRLRRRRP